MDEQTNRFTPEETWKYNMAETDVMKFILCYLFTALIYNNEFSSLIFSVHVFLAYFFFFLSDYFMGPHASTEN